MRRYVNNWQQPVVLGEQELSLALDLPDGEYRLTLSDAQVSAQRWEIIDAAVSAGIATLERALEGTSQQDWPAGSVIRAGLTAGMFEALVSAMADLQARVVALEGGSTPNGALVDQAGTILTHQSGAILIYGETI
ncbi:hypothetical protein [Pseudomonas sp.]|uniref:hypothetical protein n=1 Tax=Pseudomonas sp. TaxID=306 RepID=UPI004054657E